MRIATDEGFCINAAKTRMMKRAARQIVTGVVVNQHPNVRREEFDALKAILHNCVRFGPQSQNHAGHADFRARLRGRVSHVLQINRARGERLMVLFGRIDWNGAA